MRTVYRLYTERFDNLAPIVCRYFAGATLYETIGVWKGETKLSTVIEILGTPEDAAQIIELAREIRKTNNQQSVFVGIFEYMRMLELY